jgi:hypothetical protein
MFTFRHLNINIKHLDTKFDFFNGWLFADSRICSVVKGTRRESVITPRIKILLITSRIKFISNLNRLNNFF